MPERFIILTNFDHWANENSWNVVALPAIILIPSDNKQTIVRFCPLHKRIKMLFEPAIPLLDTPIVHIIEQIGYDKGDRG